ncbi:hypothetical protein ABT297_04305 [Dactylosporangium sp. NPDC000555]|uniref:hypothetical protein n=1 Tax=Dactylosporangium sp. NPDC000555 TaxID=3154260 RepID=UPI0033341BB8
MTDVLDRLADVGDELFRRVGDALAGGGLPADGSLRELLRRVGALPDEVLEHALRLDVDGLRAAALELRGVAGRFGELPGRLEADIGRSAWEGGSAEAFGIVWDALAAHIGEEGEPATITGRLVATAAYLDALAAWAAGFRYELAEAIARVATSAEAVTVLTARGEPSGDGTEIAAAAGRIARRVLQTAADALDAAEELRGRWTGRLAELEYQPPRVPSGPAVISGVTRVNL